MEGEGATVAVATEAALEVVTAEEAISAAVAGTLVVVILEVVVTLAEGASVVDVRWAATRWGACLQAAFEALPGAGPFIARRLPVGAQ